MEVKPGYKQTEVGVIPEDWEVKPLHSLADKIMVGIASASDTCVSGTGNCHVPKPEYQTRLS